MECRRYDNYHYVSTKEKNDKQITMIRTGEIIDEITIDDCYEWSGRVDNQEVNPSE